MTTQERARESFTEWGVRWGGDRFWQPPAQGIFAAENVAEDAVRRFAADMAPAYGAVVVHRTVIRSAWREPVSMEAVAAAIEAGEAWHCTMLGVEDWPDCGRCEGTGHIEECPDCEGIGKIRPADVDAGGEST